MEVKTDTKEKFSVIRVQTPELSADMAAILTAQFEELLKGRVRNVVLYMAAVKSISEAASEAIVRCQQKFYEAGASFVICALTQEVDDYLDSNNLLELMNVTPTESEAGDIVQMEEIERELLDDEFEEEK